MSRFKVNRFMFHAHSSLSSYIFILTPILVGFINTYPFPVFHRNPRNAMAILYIPAAICDQTMSFIRISFPYPFLVRRGERRSNIIGTRFRSADFIHGGLVAKASRRLMPFENRLTSAKPLASEISSQYLQQSR